MTEIPGEKKTKPSKPILEKARGSIKNPYEKAKEVTSDIFNLDMASIMKGKLKLEVKLNEDDKKFLTEKLDKIADKVDYRWKVTQWIMVVAIGIGIVGEAVKYL